MKVDLVAGGGWGGEREKGNGGGMRGGEVVSTTIKGQKVSAGTDSWGLRKVDSRRHNSLGFSPNAFVEGTHR